jgi:hypothetical protein
MMGLGVPCIFCSRPAVHRHHPTGRDVAGAYLDAGFMVPLDARCHSTEHAAWRDAGIDDLVDPLEARLARLCWLTGRVADLGRSLGPEELRGMNDSLVACLDLVRKGAA